MKINDKALIIMGIISSALATGQLEKLPPKAINALAGVSKQASDRYLVVQIVPGASKAIQAAEISSDNPVPTYKDPYVHESTTLTGQLLKIGGDEPRATLRDDFGSTHSIKVDQKTAKLLGSKLYQAIGIDCEVIWNTETWEIVDADAIQLIDLPPVDAVDAFEELSKRVQGAWDGINVEAYFKTERGEAD